MRMRLPLYMQMRQRVTIEMADHTHVLPHHIVRDRMRETRKVSARMCEPPLAQMRPIALISVPDQLIHPIQN